MFHILKYCVLLYLTIVLHNLVIFGNILLIAIMEYIIERSFMLFYNPVLQTTINVHDDCKSNIFEVPSAVALIC